MLCKYFQRLKGFLYIPFNLQLNTWCHEILRTLFRNTVTKKKLRLTSWRHSIVWLNWLLCKKMKVFMSLMSLSRLLGLFWLNLVNWKLIIELFYKPRWWSRRELSMILVDTRYPGVIHTFEFYFTPTRKKFIRTDPKSLCWNAARWTCALISTG